MAEHKFKVGDIIVRKNTEFRIDKIVKNCIGTDCYFMVDIESEKSGHRYLKMTDEFGRSKNAGEITWICEQVDRLFEKVAPPPAAALPRDVAKRLTPWKDAQGDDLPEIDREVIALQGRKVVFAHRPNPEGWDGKSLDSGKVEHFEPQTYDKGGWNMPDVTYWLDAPLPEGIK